MILIELYGCVAMAGQEIEGNLWDQLLGQVWGVMVLDLLSLSARVQVGLRTLPPHICAKSGAQRPTFN